MTTLPIPTPSLLPETGPLGGRRHVRVVLLLLTVVALSLGDLYMTMAHLKGAGMLEANPLARALMSLNSPGILVGWKIASVVVAVGILFRARQTRSGEIGAWIAAAVLVWLTFRWVSYNDVLQGVDTASAVLAAQHDPHWVALTPK